MDDEFVPKSVASNANELSEKFEKYLKPQQIICII